MPRTRTPVSADRVRGRAGLLLGAFQLLAVIVKGLPLTYSKDLQDDKETVFGAFDALALSLAAMTGMIATLTFRTDRMRALAASGFSTATDLADWRVRVAGVQIRGAQARKSAVAGKRAWVRVGPGGRRIIIHKNGI